MGKRIRSSMEVSEELKRLLEAAKGHVMTPGEKYDQRISWVYGQLAIDNPSITREQVEQAALELYGPRPEV